MHFVTCLTEFILKIDQTLPESINEVVHLNCCVDNEGCVEFACTILGHSDCILALLLRCDFAQYCFPRQLKYEGLDDSDHRVTRLFRDRW